MSTAARSSQPDRGLSKSSLASRSVRLEPPSGLPICISMAGRTTPSQGRKLSNGLGPAPPQAIVLPSTLM